jgi:CRISPR-associated endonuclease/helicase Cas3
MATLYAKSRSRGGLTLFDHTAHVVSAAERIGAALGLNLERVRQGAVLHDLGKGHPATQAMLLEELCDADLDTLLADAPWADAVRDELRRRRAKTNAPVPHRHEFSSLLFLPLFPEDVWPDLIEMVAAHHKSIIRDGAQRGLLDLRLNEGVDRVFGRHAEQWDCWSPEPVAIAAAFGIAGRAIPLQEAERAFRLAVEYCERIPRRWSRWRGILMAADHFASAYREGTVEAAGKLFVVPDLRSYNRRADEASAYRYPLSRFPADDPRRHTLVTAPTAFHDAPPG